MVEHNLAYGYQTFLDARHEKKTLGTICVLEESVFDYQAILGYEITKLEKGRKEIKEVQGGFSQFVGVGVVGGGNSVAVGSGFVDVAVVVTGGDVQVGSNFAHDAGVVAFAGGDVPARDHVPIVGVVAFAGGDVPVEGGNYFNNNVR
ncbi:hypothetical protein Tco_0305247 [Tanacetum coccineum]